MSAITKREIEEYLADEERRRELSAQARTLGKKSELFEARLEELIKQEGGKKRRLNHVGFLLALTTAKGSVSWKNEFIRVAGAEEADKVAAAAPAKDVLVVERAA